MLASWPYMGSNRGVDGDGLYRRLRRADGQTVWAWWQPVVCASCHQPIRGGEIGVAWRPCGCAGSTASGGHPTWTHWACGTIMVWGVCDDAVPGEIDVSGIGARSPGAWGQDPA